MTQLPTDIANKARDARFIPIEGSLNFRDFGGYKTVDGGHVKLGKLFRCGSMAGIPETAYASFTQLNIGVICDLRRNDEIKFDPTPGHESFSCRVHIPIAPGSSSQMQASFKEARQDHNKLISFMQQVTQEIARDHIADYSRLFSELKNVETGFLLHCSAGKDRTGFGAAMILLMLGVAEADVYDDYLLTNQADELIKRMAPGFKKRYGDRVDTQSLNLIAGVKEEYLRAALTQVINQHGSYAAYFNAAGLDQKAQSKIKRRLIQY
ncbi:MAG: tyrosine-protein phosphatase [Pseudomonadales bacterium]|nr:tyrosine-protein phosphatase [Pseudomonadales bacterium]